MSSIRGLPTPTDLCRGCHNQLIPQTVLDGLLSKTNCSHIFHRHCIERWNQERSASCPICRNTISQLKLVDQPTDTKNSDCSICTEEMINSADKLDGLIIKNRSGLFFHHSCSQLGSNTQNSYQARALLPPPPVKVWKADERPEQDPVDHVFTDDDAAIAQRLQNQFNAAPPPPPHNRHQIPVNNNNDLTLPQMILAGVVILAVAFSLVAFLVNAQIQFSDPTLHLMSIPFYICAAVVLSISVVEFCEGF